jgi:hypothetical protein
MPEEASPDAARKSGRHPDLRQATSSEGRIMAILRSHIGLILLVAILLAGCQAEGRTFQITLPTVDKVPLPVTLTDETGLVTGITQVAVLPAMGNDPALHADPSDSSGAVLTWLGGACDTDTALRFLMLNGGYILNVSTDGGSANCPASAVPRAIRIGTSRPIPVASISVAGH